ncbi:MAG: PH domain-containing protein [Pirellulaceae bacterium]
MLPDSDRNASVPSSQDVPAVARELTAPAVDGQPVCEASPDSDLWKPQFLHPSSVVFDVLSKIRQFIFPAVVGIWGATQWGFWGPTALLGVFVVSLVVTLLRYFTLRYQIKGNDFVVTEGLLFRRIRAVPIRRIQNMDLVQNVLHRIFRVAEVRIETASGTEPEATLRVLTHSQIAELRAGIFGSKLGEPESLLGATEMATVTEVGGSEAAVLSDSSLAEPPLVAEPSASGAQLAEAADSAVREVYKIPFVDLLKAGMASNRGTVLIGIVIGYFFQFDFESRFDAGTIRREIRRTINGTLRDYLPAVDGPWQFLPYLIIGAIVLFLALRLFGMGWYVLRFFDYRLTRQGNDMRIATGLLTRVSATVPRQRIQFMSVHRPLLLRWMGLASIRLETAGGAGQESENAAATVSRRWFLPVVRESEVQRVLDELRPGLNWRETEVTTTWHGVSPLAGKRLMRIALILCALLSLVTGVASPPWGWLAGVAAFPVFAWIAVKKARARRYARTDWGLVYQSGLFTKKLSFAFYDRLQTLEVQQSPFDRRWKMASLVVDTAAAGPADHRIQIDYLEASFAQRQFDELHQKAASHRPAWT